MPKLYEWSDEFEAVYREIAKNDGELTDEVKEKLYDLELSFEDKLGGCVKMLRSIESDCNACDAEAKRLTTRSKAMKNKAEWLRTYMQDCMVASSMHKVQNSLFTATITPSPPSVDILSIDMIPDEFTMERKREVSKSAIKDAIQRGQEVPGATLVRKETLRIR